MSLSTVAEYRRAVRDAKRVFTQPRFGVSECYVRTSKADALYLVRGMKGTTTARELELYAESFGTFEGDDLFVG